MYKILVITILLHGCCNDLNPTKETETETEYEFDLVLRPETELDFND